MYAKFNNKNAGKTEGAYPAISNLNLNKKLKAGVLNN